MTDQLVLDRPAPASVPVRRIAGLAAPLVASTLAVLGAQLAVTGMVGRIGDAALYVRAVYTPVAFLFVAVGTGLAVTAQVAVARSVGGGRREHIGAYLGGTARLGIAVCAVLGVALVAGAGMLGDLAQVGPEHRAVFVRFLVAMAAVGAFGLLGELAAAVLRGMGHGGTAAMLTATYVTLNLGLVAVVGLALEVGLMAVPLATAVSGSVELLLGLAILRRLGVLRGLRARRPDTTRLALAVGLPVAGSYLLLFVVNVLLLRIVARFGELAVAGFTIGYSVQTFVVVPAVGVGSAIAILMNQQLAGGARALVPETFRRGLGLVAVAYLVVTVALLAAGRPLVGLLSANPDIVAHAWRFVAVVGPTFGFTGLVLAALTVLEQVGHGPFAIGMHVVYFAAIVSVGWWAVARSGDVGDLYLTMAVAASISVVTALSSAWWAVRRTGLRPLAGEVR